MLTITVVCQAKELSGGDLQLKSLWAVRNREGEHGEALVSFTHKAEDVGSLALVIAQLAGRVEAHPVAPASRILT